MESSPSIMILGTYHMENPDNGDMFNAEADSVFSIQRQSELREVIELMKQFNPTKIALEVDFTKQDELHMDYKNYLSGSFELTASEIHQIGFKIAQELGHSSVHAVDWNQAVNGINLGNVFEWAKEHENEKFENLMALGQKIMQEDGETFKNKSIREILLAFNDLNQMKETQRYYMDLGTIGTHDHPIGAKWISQYWYFRNLIIYSNITKLIDSPSERVLVIYGRGHLYLLDQYVREGGKFNIESPLNYLNARLV